eukprot:GILI01023943.1.p1 GENE.GILI01023943.1~~GILI01023943.1.p1  ORF type:complete len:111 (-),score=14.98 GILI01023943.1:71-403(-)
MFSIANLLKVIILCLNSMAILSERRFLAPMGLATIAPDQNQNQNRTSSNFYNEDPFGGTQNFGGNPTKGFGHQSPVKAQIAHLLSSVRMLLRWPLIIVNICFIIFSLIFG